MESHPTSAANDVLETKAHRSTAQQELGHRNLTYIQGNYFYFLPNYLTNAGYK